MKTFHFVLMLLVVACGAEAGIFKGGFSGSFGASVLSDHGPPTEAPNVPTLQATTTDTTLTLTVPGDDDYTNYDFRICEGAGCTSFTEQSRDTDSPYTFTGLTPGETYGYWARAKNAVGNSGYTSFQYINTTGGSAGLPAPTNLAIYPSANSAGIFWDGGEGSTSEYELSLCLGAGCTSYASPITVNEADGSFLNITGLLEQQTWGVQVVALDSSGNTSSALTGEFTTPVAPTAPYDPPVPVFGIGVTDTTLTFIPSGITNFESFEWR